MYRKKYFQEKVRLLQNFEHFFRGFIQSNDDDFFLHKKSRSLAKSSLEATRPRKKWLGMDAATGKTQ
jgi:hypothetical protein